MNANMSQAHYCQDIKIRIELECVFLVYLRILYAVIIMISIATARKIKYFVRKIISCICTMMLLQVLKSYLAINRLKENMNDVDILVMRAMQLKN